MQWRQEMPTFVTVSIYDSSCSRMLLEWTISDEDDECEDRQDKRKILKKKASNYIFPVVLS